MTDPTHRSAIPPDFLIISQALRNWHGMFDAAAERVKVNAQAAEHRRKYGADQSPDEVAHAKRRNGNGNGRSSG